MSEKGFFLRFHGWGPWREFSCVALVIVVDGMGCGVGSWEGFLTVAIRAWWLSFETARRVVFCNIASVALFLILGVEMKSDVHI